MGDNLTAVILQVGGRERGGTPVEVVLVEEEARKTFSPSSFFSLGK